MASRQSSTAILVLVSVAVVLSIVVTVATISCLNTALASIVYPCIILGEYMQAPYLVHPTVNYGISNLVLYMHITA